MKLIALLGAAALVAAANAQTVVVPDQTGGYAVGSAYNKLWNSGNLITINGKVTGRLVAPPMSGMINGVSLLVKQPNKPAYEVQLGPQWFVERLPVKINTGDNIIVTGSRAKIGSNNIILAQSVTVRKRELRFRDKVGNPLWTTVQVNVSAPSDPSATGEIIDRRVVSINGVDYNVYRINTGAETMDIVGEPTWLGNRQPTSFNVGYNVQVIGLRPPLQIAPNLYLADGFYSGGTLITIRPPWGY